MSDPFIPQSLREGALQASQWRLRPDGRDREGNHVKSEPEGQGDFQSILKLEMRFVLCCVGLNSLEKTLNTSLEG